MQTLLGYLTRSSLEFGLYAVAVNMHTQANDEGKSREQAEPLSLGLIHQTLPLQLKCFLRGK
jgi:hypothetical protein